MSKKKTAEEFIAEANKIHNNKYDYSLIEYKGNKTKVKTVKIENKLVYFLLNIKILTAGTDFGSRISPQSFN